MKKIIKNIIMSIFTHKVQMICLMILIVLSSSFFIGVQSANAAVINEEKYLNYHSGRHQFIIDLTSTKFIMQKPNDPDMANNLYKPIKDDVDKLIAKLKQKNSGWQFGYSIVDTREVYSGIDAVEADKKIPSYLFKVQPFSMPSGTGSTSEEENADRPIIISGHAPTNPNEIAINPNFAKNHHLKLGSQLTIQSLPYTVVGLAVSANMLWPQMDMLNVIPNLSTSGIVYCNFDAYYNGNNFVNSSSTDREIYVVIRTTSDKPTSEFVGQIGDINFNFEETVKSITDLSLYFIKNRIDENSILPSLSGGNYYNYNNAAYRYASRVNTFDLFVAKSRQFLLFFMLILLITSIFIIFIITRKWVFQDIGKIAIFKANGYYNLEISIAYVFFAIITAAIGIILGTVLSFLMYYTVYSGYYSFFLLPTPGVKFNLLTIFYNSLIADLFIMIFVALVTYTILFINIRKNVVKLINKG